MPVSNPPASTSFEVLFLGIGRLTMALSERAADARPANVQPNCHGSRPQFPHTATGIAAGLGAGIARTSRFGFGVEDEPDSGKKADGRLRLRFRAAGRAGMARSGNGRRRAEKSAKEHAKIAGGRFKSDGTSKTLFEIEDEAIDFTDFVASVVTKESAAELPNQKKPCHCPQCGAVPKASDDDEDPASSRPTELRSTGAARSVDTHRAPRHRMLRAPCLPPG